MPGPTAAELTGEQVNALEQAADRARAELARDLHDRPGVSAARELDPDVEAALAAFRAAYVAAGVDAVRADRAVTCWMILARVSCVEALDQADAGTWRQPGDGPGGLGQRQP